jgi:hypothetical protein
MTRYLFIAIVAGIAALVVAPIAGAADTPVDDYWRDQAAAVSLTSDTSVDDYFRDAPATLTFPPDTIVDDYFRDAPATVAAPPATIVDDYFRDPPTVVTSGSAFDWGDFGLGIVTATGAMLLLAGLVLAFLAARQGRAQRTRPTGAA